MRRFRSEAAPERESTRQRPAVALLTPSLGGGGVERVMVNLANGLSRSGLRVDLVALCAQGEYRDQVAPDVHIVDLATPRASRAINPLRRYLRRNRPQVLLAALEYLNLGALVANALTGSRTRVFVSTHKAFTVSIERSELMRERLFMRGAVRLAYPRAAGIIAISEAMADELSDAASIPRERISVLPNIAVTDEVLRLAEASPSHPWLKEPEVPVLLGVGRLHEQKDFHTLLRAVAIVSAEKPVRLVVFGEGNERPGLERLRDELGLGDAVDFPGFVDNPYAHMRQAAAFVLSSRYEGLPTVLIEAMSTGCPVVSTDCPTGPSEILDGGRYGPLVPVGDAEALAAAILRVLEQPRVSDAMRARAMDYHTERVVTRYRALFGL